MEHPLKRLLGRSADDYMAPKVRWLLRDLAKRPPGAGACRTLLDYGCGTGTFLRHLRRAAFPARLHGCDVSIGMLNELKRTWDGPDLPELEAIAEGRAPFPDAAFGVVVVCAVLHHVPAARRAALFDDVARLLAPGGRVYVFDLNPYQPVTRWVVSQTESDRNAELVAARHVAAGLRGAGLTGVRSRYLLFLPPRWRWTYRADDWLGRVPLGGQYVVTGDKPA
jgi:SAM-dependent methyltransferase